MTATETKSFLKPAFIVCAAILLSAAIAKETVIRALGVQMVKQPIALQHPLDEMNAAALAPFELKDRKRIQNRDVLDSLGTEEYLQWMLEDSEADPDSPMRHCSLFITYYTGNPDMVPHVPDECYVGGGNTRQGGGVVTVNIPRDDGEQKLDFQYVAFRSIDRRTMREDNFSVQYFFHANGKYSGSRTDTRLILGSNWFSKYSYFCKVEWKFYGIGSFGLIYPDKEQTLAASKKLMEKLLPELEKNHWPDWEKINNE
ncbi:MAG: hypothetical protein ABFR90_10920 [Planctomycetota bacterium]